MKRVVVIPARMAATRFPGKPLARIMGLPMIEHVRRRSLLSKEIDEVWVATCDPEIKDLVESFSGNVIMTSDKHERCSDRIAEANSKIKADIVVNVQGDEPLVRPETIDQLVIELKKLHKNYGCVNFISEIKVPEEITSTNVVKTVIAKNWDALFFSRHAVPYQVKPLSSFKYYKQLGLMAFTKDFLENYAKMAQTPLEIAESVDMLRPLENGMPIRTLLTEFQTVGVDVPGDIGRAEALLKNDPYLSRYIEKN